MWNAERGPMAWWRRTFGQPTELGADAAADPSAVSPANVTPREEEAPAPPPVPARVWIDGDGLMSQIGGDTALLQELTRLFEMERTRRLIALREAIADQDGCEIKSAAHAIKSGLTNFCSPEAVALAAELEMAGRAAMAGDASAIIGLEPKVDVLAACMGDMLIELQSMGEAA